MMRDTLENVSFIATRVITGNREIFFEVHWLFLNNVKKNIKNKIFLTNSELE